MNLSETVNKARSEASNNLLKNETKFATHLMESAKLESIYIIQTNKSGCLVIKLHYDSGTYNEKCIYNISIPLFPNISEGEWLIGIRSYNFAKMIPVSIDVVDKFILLCKESSIISNNAKVLLDAYFAGEFKKWSDSVHEAVKKDFADKAKAEADNMSKIKEELLSLGYKNISSVIIKDNDIEVEVKKSEIIHKIVIRDYLKYKPIIEINNDKNNPIKLTKNELCEVVCQVQNFLSWIIDEMFRD